MGLARAKSWLSARITIVMFVSASDPECRAPAHVLASLLSLDIAMKTRPLADICILPS